MYTLHILFYIFYILKIYSILIFPHTLFFPSKVKFFCFFLRNIFFKTLAGNYKVIIKQEFQIFINIFAGDSDFSDKLELHV